MKQQWLSLGKMEKGPKETNNYLLMPVLLIEVFYLNWELLNLVGGKLYHNLCVVKPQWPDLSRRQKRCWPNQVDKDTAMLWNVTKWSDHQRIDLLLLLEYLVNLYLAWAVWAISLLSRLRLPGSWILARFLEHPTMPAKKYVKYR